MWDKLGLAYLSHIQNSCLNRVRCYQYEDGARWKCLDSKNGPMVIRLWRTWLRSCLNHFDYRTPEFIHFRIQPNNSISILPLCSTLITTLPSQIDPINFKHSSSNGARPRASYSSYAILIWPGPGCWRLTRLTVNSSLTSYNKMQQ